MTKVLKRPLSILLSLVLVLGLIPGMSLTAYAASHSITINNAQHGTVTATVNGSAASSAEEGATVTLTANPDEGYRLKSISGTYKNYYSESFGTGGGTKTHFKVTSTCQTNGAGWRLYNNGTVTVTSTGTQKITKVVFTGCRHGMNAGAGQLGVSSGNLSISGNTIVINNLSNVTSFTLTGKGNNAATQWQSSGVTVYGDSGVDTQLPIKNTSDSNVCTFTMPAVATGNVLITAEFEELPKYTVTWKNGDTVLETDENVAEGTMPEYNGNTPVKDEDEINTYTFSGWSPAITAVTGDAEYTAQFTAVPKPKKLTLNVGENGKVVMDNGTFGNATDANNIVEVPAPINVADGSKIFIVDGRSANLVEGGSINIATGGEVSLYPSADNTGKITAIPDEGYALYGWYDGDTLYSEDTVLAYQNIDKTTTLTAVFAPAHTVTWKDAGGTILRTDTIAEGKTPSYGSTPTKANDDYHSYHFSGWTDGTNTYGASDTLPAVTGDVTYTAKYTVFTKQFTVFVKTTTGKTITANGVSGDTTVAELKDMVVEESGIPAAEQRLIFAGKEMENEKTLADYRIQRESTLHVVGKSYTITWKNDDGTVIDTTSVAYGTTPTYDGETPEKAEDANYTYTFAGWSPEITAVTGDVTYTATFDAVRKTIKYDDEHTLNPNDRIAVSDEDEGKKKFDLHLNQYLNMQMLGVQLKKSIETKGGDDGIRFVTAVNSNLLKGNNIKDYGYIVVKAKADTPVEKIYAKMDNLTYNNVDGKNRFKCYGSSNTISGKFGQYASETEYKYVTLSLTGTGTSNDTVAARFYVQTKDDKYYYADYIDGNNATHGGMAFNLVDVFDNLK